MACNLHAHVYLCRSSPQLLSLRNMLAWTQSSGTHDHHIFVDIVRPPIGDVKAGALAHFITSCNMKT